jgi:hypothetical protein
LALAVFEIDVFDVRPLDQSHPECPIEDSAFVQRDTRPRVEDIAGEDDRGTAKEDYIQIACAQFFIG